jgi:hypothetical protein
VIGTPVNNDKFFRNFRNFSNPIFRKILKKYRIFSNFFRKRQHLVCAQCLRPSASRRATRKKHPLLKNYLFMISVGNQSAQDLDPRDKCFLVFIRIAPEVVKNTALKTHFNFSPLCRPRSSLRLLLGHLEIGCPIIRT